MPSADELSRLLRTLCAAPMRPELWSVLLKDFAYALSLPAAAILQHSGTHKEHRFEIAAGLGRSMASATTMFRFCQYRRGE